MDRHELPKSTIADQDQDLVIKDKGAVSMNNHNAGRTLRLIFILALSFRVHKLDDGDDTIFDVPLSTEHHLGKLTWRK